MSKRVLIALVMVVCALSSDARADWFDTFGYGVYAARAGDIISTEFALSHSGVIESNPLSPFQHRGVRIATMAGAPLINFLTAKLHKDKPKLALIIRIVAVVAWSSAAAHNTRVGLSW